MDERTFAATGGNRQRRRLIEAWRLRRNECEPGQCTRDDNFPNQVWLKDGFGVVRRIAQIPLTASLVSWDRVRKSGRWCAPGYITTKGATRTSLDLYRVSNVRGSGSRAPYAGDSVPTPRLDLVKTRVSESVDRSLPTSARAVACTTRAKVATNAWPVFDADGEGIIVASDKGGISPR